jgi:hypothetical protein
MGAFSKHCFDFIKAIGFFMAWYVATKAWGRLASTVSIASKPSVSSWHGILLQRQGGV